MACSSASIWAVADGMGGHDAGDLASRSIADALYPQPGVLAGCPALADRVDWIEDQLLSVDRMLHERASAIGPGTIIGSTVVSLTIDGATGVVLWAGDSRLYRVRDGQLAIITRDHNPIIDLLESGTVSEQEALAADTNVITRAVGGQRPLELDVAVFDVSPADVFLLCTDGLYREVTDDEMVDVLQDSFFDVEAAASHLQELALSRPARDNLSLLLLHSVDHVAN